MLQKIRDKSSGVLAYVVVGAIALMFSVWGIGSYFTPSADPVVATVAGNDITQNQLQRAYNQRYQQLRRMLGDAFDAGAIDTQKFRHNVLQALIQEALLSAHAEDHGYRVTDAALLAAISSDPRFAVDGQFSAPRYRTLLSQAGLSAAGYEAAVRRDLSTQQVKDTILDTAFVTSHGLERAYQLAHQQRELAVLLFDPSDFADQVQIHADEVQAWYQEHPQSFLRPERVKVDYLVLDRDAMEPAQAPDQAVLKALYAEQKEARFQSPERRLARQLLIKVDDADASAEQARQKIQDLSAKLREPGADFAAVAREVSDDQATAGQGGQMDWVARGTLVEPLEEALFALQPGTVSAPVKTKLGWHLLKLEKIDAPVTKPFDSPEVQSELLAQYRKKAGEDRFREMRKRLDALSFEAPTSLEPIAEELGLEIRTSDWITREGSNQGLAANPAVVTGAFSPAVLQDQLNSTPIQLSDGRVAVLRVNTHQNAERLPLEQVKEQIVEQLRLHKAQEIARGAAQEALAALRDGAQASALAGRGEAKFIEPRWVGRDDAELDPALRTTLFTMPKPAEHPQYATATTGEGKIALLCLSQVKAPTPAETDAADSQALKRALRERIAALEYAVFSQVLREEYDVTEF